MKKLALTILALMLALSLCTLSCGIAEEKTNLLAFEGMGPAIKTTTELKAAKSYKIAVVVKNMTNPGMVAQVEGAAKACADMGCEVIKLSPANADSVEDQVSLVDDMVQMGVDGILIHCADSNGIMPAIRRAQKANIPVVGMGTVPAEETLMRTGPDYGISGTAMAKYVAEKLGGKGKIILLEGAPGAQNNAERRAAIEEILKAYPEIEIVASQTANWKRVEAMSVMENLLQKFSDVNAIIALNDEMAVGALQAVEAANLSNIMIVGFDGNADCSAAVQNGSIAATYNCDWYGTGYVATAYLVQYLNDGTFPPQYHMAYPSSETNAIIDSTSIDEYLDKCAWFNY